LIKHIVMFKFKEFSLGRNKQENIDLVRELLQSLPSKIKKIRSFELGINIIPGSNAYDLVLLSEFNSFEELAGYQKHPEHLKVAEVVGQVCESRIVVDYARDDG